MGTAPNNLSLAATWLRQQRIYQASEYTSSTVRKPYRPYLEADAWIKGQERFDKHLVDVQAQLALCPPVFTKRQWYVVGALFFLWDTQGPDARCTYDDIQAITQHITVDGYPPSHISRNTIAYVLGMLSETGAIKYIRGWQGQKSWVSLVDLHALHSLPHRNTHKVHIPQLSTHAPVTKSVPLHGTQQLGFGYWTLLREQYSSLPAAKVTRTFNQELRQQGLAGRQVPEWVGKSHYPSLTWYIWCEPTEDWKLQSAVNITIRRLA